jgi:trehalose synthase
MKRKATSDVWWENAVVYCLDVETFLDGDGDGCGDLRGLCERIEYLTSLGVGCLWLMPFMPSSQRDDGYDITDFYGVDPRLGTHGDMLEVIRAAREGGMRVIADLVVNHTSDQHPWFKDARRGPASPFHDFYVWRDEKPEEKPDDIVFPDREESNWAFDEEAGRWYLHRFYSHQPDLNVDNPEVRDEIAQAVGFWLEQGLSGFRVDAVPFLIEPPGDGESADPHELLRDLRRFIGRRSGEAVLLGEVNLTPGEQREFFGDEDGDELQLIFSFPVNQAMFLSLAREDATPLAKALEALPPIPEDCQWGNFVRNHDELTLDKLSEDERAEVFAAFGPEEELQLYGRGLRRRLPTMLGGDQRRIRMVYSLAFSLPGTPVLFYGEEIGMAENLAIEGRYSVRAPMQWSGEPHGGFTTSDEPCRPLVDGGPFGFPTVNVAQQRRDPDGLLHWMQRLIHRRRECPELGWGEWELLDGGSPAAFALRSDWDGSTIVTVHNLAGRDLQVRLAVGGEGALDDLFRAERHALDDGAVELELAPYDARWFRVQRPGERLPP